MLPIGFTTPADATHALATSALPDAPVLPAEPDGAPTRRWRSRTARLLRSLAAGADRAAERVERRQVGCGGQVALRHH